MNEKLVDLSLITHLQRYSNDFSRFGDSFVFSHMTSQEKQGSIDMSMPIRFGGLMFTLCLSGEISVDVNLNTYLMTANTVTIVGPDSIVKVNDVAANVDVYTLFISQEFIRDINIDINTLSPRMYSHPRSPLFKLSVDEMALLKRYFELLHFNAKENEEDVYSKNISRCLIASILYQMMQFVNKKKDDEAEVDTTNFSRRMNYVQEFIRLVHKYHRSERSVGFYANKLFISPKYLSLIVKEATGRSAAEWIDEYVILEAKNMLRFSGKNIQQVAYELNFTSQSSFGKYFKHLTGMSPSEFMKM